MTLDQAIKTGAQILASDRLKHWAEAEATVQLLIEAGKQIKEARSYGLVLSEATLPGENDEPLHVKP